MFYITVGTQEYKFTDFDDALDFCFERGLDPDKFVVVAH
jgi:hypothetical protein